MALALVLTAAATALSVRLTPATDASLRALGPHLDRIAAARGFPRVEEPRFARRPCRMNALAGAAEARYLGRTYLRDLEMYEVAVYRVPEPRARTREVVSGLLRCGSFESSTSEGPFRFAITAVEGPAPDGSVRYRLHGTGAGGRLTTYSNVRLLAVGPYLLYVNHQLAFTDPPPSSVESFAAEAAGALEAHG